MIFFTSREQHFIDHTIKGGTVPILDPSFRQAAPIGTREILKENNMPLGIHPPRYANGDTSNKTAKATSYSPIQEIFSKYGDVLIVSIALIPDIDPPFFFTKILQGIGINKKHADAQFLRNEFRTPHEEPPDASSPVIGDNVERAKPGEEIRSGGKLIELEGDDTHRGPVL